MSTNRYRERGICLLLFLLRPLLLTLCPTVGGLPFADFTPLNNTLAALGCYASPFCVISETIDDCPAEALNSTDPVRCDENGNIIYLRLGDQGLAGSLPSDIGGLSYLSLLILGLNQLQGTVPTEIALLTNLHVLDLSANQLQGVVPFVNSSALIASYCFLQLATSPGNCLDLTSRNCVIGDCQCDAAGGVCSMPTGAPTPSTDSNKAIIIAVVVIVLVFAWYIFVLCLYYWKKAGKLKVKLPWYDRHVHRFRMR